MARSKVITVNHVGAGAAASPFLAGPSCLPQRSLGLTTRPALRASSDQRGSRANSEYPPLLLRAYRHHVWQAWLGHSYFSAGPHAFAVARQSLCLAQREFQRPAILAAIVANKAICSAWGAPRSLQAGARPVSQPPMPTGQSRNRWWSLA